MAARAESADGSPWCCVCVCVCVWARVCVCVGSGKRRSDDLADLWKLKKKPCLLAPLGVLLLLEVDLSSCRRPWLDLRRRSWW